MRTPKKTTAAERKRRMAAEQERLAALSAPAASMADQHEQILATYVPRKVTKARWDAGMSDFVRDLVRRGQCTGDKTVRQLLSEVALYVDWAIDQGIPMTMEAMLDHDLIDRWVSVHQPTGSKTTWANRRSRLRNLASHVLPSPKAPRRPEPIGRCDIKAPYTLRETADMERLALAQPTVTLRRQLCAIIGLGLGAGLSPTDLRYLTAGDIEFDLAGGCRVQIRGLRPRTVRVRARYVEMLREAVKGLKDGDLVLGTKPTRKGITGNTIARAAIGTTTTVPDQGRLRATWILAAMTTPMPLATLMTAAGVVSGRTFTDLMPYCTDPAYVMVGDQPC